MKRSVTLWKLLELIPLWIIGGTVYYLIEFFWRGQSHWTMFLLGGVLFVLLGLMNEVIQFRFPLVLQGVAGAALVTLAELMVGMVVNRYLGVGGMGLFRSALSIPGSDLPVLFASVGSAEYGRSGAGR